MENTPKEEFMIGKCFHMGLRVRCGLFISDRVFLCFFLGCEHVQSCPFEAGSKPRLAYEGIR